MSESKREFILTDYSRPMYANAYGVDGITHLIDIMKNEIVQDAGNLGITDIQKIDISRVSLSQ